jgi:hypothetical protein
MDFSQEMELNDKPTERGFKHGQEVRLLQKGVAGQENFSRKS